MLFSIIVPVYNIENYISDCLDSILKQTYTDFEVIIVDDGSTDKSGKLCDKYSNFDSRFKTFHKDNEGLSATRNYGIRKAKGEYLIFIDGDDYIDGDALNNIKKAIDIDTDVVITRLVQQYPDSIEYTDEGIDKVDYQNQEEHFEWLFKEAKSIWPAPKYIVRHDFIIANRLCFLNGYLHEDVDWTSRLFTNNINTSVCTYPWYYHRLSRPGSITSTIRGKNIIDVLNIASKYYNDYAESDNERFSTIFNRIMISVYGMLKNYKYVAKEDREAVINCLKQHMSLLSYAPAPKYKLFSIVARCLGPRLAMTLLSKGN